MNQQQGGLREIVDRYYHNSWALSPTAGSRAGLYEFDGRLELPDRDYFAERQRLIVRGTAEVKTVPSPQPGTLEELDRKVFDAHLTVAALRLETIQHWRRDPAQPLTEAVESLFELMMRRELSNPETLRAIAHRLEALPAYLKAARSRIDDPVGLWVTIAEHTAPGAIAFITNAVMPLGDSHATLRDEFTRAGRKAIEAVQDYAAWLGELRGRPLADDVAIGSEALTQLVRHWHGLTESLDEIEELGRTLIRYFREELKRHAELISPGSTWQEVIEQARNVFIRSDRNMLEAYRRVTQELRERMIRDELLELPPGEECRVIATPTFMRALLPTAAYTNPGPLDPRQVGVFFVTEPDRALGEESYRANVAQHYGIEETSVHEAYPGHHVQNCWANRASSLARQMADHIVFMEGWTLYCEQWMIEKEWFPDPALTINYLIGQLWRACRIVIDVGLHTRTLGVADAVQMLMDGPGFTRERAETELNWYSQSPGVPMSYLLGKRETLDLRDAFMRRPGATLRDFHRWLLQFGSVPQRWLRELLP